MKYFTGLLFLALSLSSTVRADTQITIAATSLRLQNYVPGYVTVWYAGSTCASGNLSSSNLTPADVNRLYATVLSAKLTKHDVYFYYNVVNGACQITSFGMDN